MSSQAKRRWWVYLLLVLMLAALIGFSVLPLLGSIAQQQAYQPNPGIVSPRGDRSQLEAEASGYQQVLAREPNNETALRGLIRTRLKQGYWQEAIVPLETMMRLHPEQSDYGLLLAQVKQQLGDLLGAVEAYQAVLAIQPGSLEALEPMINLLLQQNRSEAAIAILQKTLATAQNDSETFPVDKRTSVQLLLGLVYEINERYREAIALYDQLLAQSPPDFRPLIAKALVLRKQGKQEQAKPLIEQALSLAPPGYQERIKALVTQSQEEDAA